MIELKGKKILLISPSFFNYEIEIKNKLEERGAYVTLYDDRPSSNSLIKGVIRFNKNLITPLINNYYSHIIKRTKDKKFDIIFFMKGESITTKALLSLKINFPRAIFVLYLWDSISNNSNPEIFKYFDKILSFDKNDCINNNRFIFRPLFYLDYFKNIGENNESDFLFDVSFIGTVHSDRYFIIKNIISGLNIGKYKSFIIMFLPSKMLFWFRKFTDSKFRNVPISDIEFKSTPFKEVTKCFKNSKTIIDIQHPLQTGLTMRCIEALGAKKKLITTNKDVINYDFFNKSNICVIDRNGSFDTSFLASDYINVSNEIYYKYSIDGWIDDCLNDR